MFNKRRKVGNKIANLEDQKEEDQDNDEEIGVLGRKKEKASKGNLFSVEHAGHEGGGFYSQEDGPRLNLSDLEGKLS